MNFVQRRSARCGNLHLANRRRRVNFQLIVTQGAGRDLSATRAGGKILLDFSGALFRSVAIG